MALIRVGDTIHREAKVKTAAEGVTLLSVVEAALRQYIDHKPPPIQRPELNAAHLKRFGEDVIATLRAARRPGPRAKTPPAADAILLAAGACLSCPHGLAQHIARKGSRSRFCQHAGCACRIQ